MYEILCVTDIVVLAVLTYMLFLVIRMKNSDAKVSFLFCVVAVIITILGMYLELCMSDFLSSALMALKLQYVGQAVWLMALLWFASIFSNFRVPKWIYVIQFVINFVVLTSVFTVEHHRLFYTSMIIIRDGYYNRIKVGDGPIWVLHYVHMFLVFIAIVVVALIKYKKSSRIQKKRILYLTGGIGVILVELVLKGVGVFGSYNPFVLAALVMVVCLYVGIIRYGFFDSIKIATENVLNHGTEGLIVIDEEGGLLFANQLIKELLPELNILKNVKRNSVVCQAMAEQENILIGDTRYAPRVEEIIEQGETGGYMIWLINMTKYYEEYCNVNEWKYLC